MAIVTTFTAKCDKCGQFYSQDQLPGTSMTTFMRDLRNMNWSVGKQVLCPFCKNKNSEATK